MSIKIVNFGLNDNDLPEIKNDKSMNNYTIRKNAMKVSKKSKPLKRFENTVEIQSKTKKNKEKVAEMPNSLGEIAACTQQQLNIEDTDSLKSGLFKRPYSAHGYKVTNTKLKRRKTKEIDKDNYITAYKEYNKYIYIIQ